MENDIFLQSTRFVNIRGGKSILGWRLWDGLSCTYGYGRISTEPLDFLKYVIEDSDYFGDSPINSVLCDILDSVHHNGITIDDCHFNYDDIQHLFVNPNKEE